MFKRRTPITLGQKFLGFFWPPIGWRRAGAYTMHRLARMPGSAYSIAGGFACGAAMSFTPLVGLHFIFAAILAWIIRTNILAAAIGTAVGNPWTFPFIWTWLYQSGSWLTSSDRPEGMETPVFSKLFAHLMEALLRFDIQFLMETVGPVFWPMLVSGIPTGIVVWVVFYFPLKYMVRGYQKRRHRRRGGGYFTGKEP